MAETISTDELVKNCENVYEAIVIMAKRARQINEEQKRILDLQNETNDKELEYDDEEFNRELVDRKYVKFPKPTTIAITEMIQGKLKFRYIEDKPVKK